MSLLSKAANSDWAVKWRLMLVLFLLGYSEQDVENSVLDPYMDVDQVAEWLGIHPETVRRLTRQRDLTSVNVGGQWRYKKSQVEQDLASWTERRQGYYSRVRVERAQAKRRAKRRRALGLDDEYE